MISKYNTHHQERILDDIENSYSTNVIAKKNLVNSRKFLIGSNVVYQVYFKYGYISEIEDNCGSHPKCLLDAKQFENIYKRYRSLEASEKLILEKYPNNVCGYCRTSRATEIDHYLPQSKFRSYSLIYNNLVPSCHNCNHSKGHDVPIRKKSWFFHPNFEEIDHKFCLNVEVSNNYREIIFSIKNPTSDTLIKSYDFSLTVLGIYNEYSRLTNTELVETLQMYHNLKIRKGSDRALRLFQEKKNANARGYNELWKRSLYKFLVSNQDFRERGYIQYLKNKNIIL